MSDIRPTILESISLLVSGDWYCGVGGDEHAHTRMLTPGAVFQPDEIILLKSALDEAATILPQAKRTSAMKVKLASRILAAAAKGERDPIQLRIAALLEVVDE
jgi:hypothetical protein